MALKNPLSVKFAKALKRAYKRGEIKERDGRIVPKSHFKMFFNGIFGPTTDADGRKALMQKEFDAWKGYGVQFPGYVHQAYLQALNGLKSKSFWDGVLDVIVTVASNPAFSAVVGVATAAIPGVGAALAPVAVALQRKVTSMVVDARAGNLKAGNVLSAAAEVAAAGVSAASPAAGALVDKAKTVIATARTVAGSKETQALVRSMAAARRLVVRAQQGDAHAAASIQVTAEKAKKGHKPSLRKLAFITAVAKGMKDGHVPKATKDEKKHYGRIAVLKFKRLSPAARLLAKSAASQEAPVAKLTAPPPEDDYREEEEQEELDQEMGDEGDEYEQDDDEGGEEVGAPMLRPGSLAPRKPAPARPAFRLAPTKPVAGRLAKPMLVSPKLAKVIAMTPDRDVDEAVSAKRISPAAASLIKSVNPASFSRAIERASEGKAAEPESPVEMTSVPAAPTASAPAPYSPAYSPPEDDEYEYGDDDEESDDEYEDEDAA